MKEVIKSSGIQRDLIKYAMLGRTHCTNAIVERKRLNDITIVRIGAPATLAVKPLIGVPDDLVGTVARSLFELKENYNVLININLFN